jgi:hypothetical protein
LRFTQVNVDYDSLLPLHLNTEGLRTLPVVHERNIGVNSLAFSALLKESEVSATNMSNEHTIGQDSWSARVSVRAPPEASAGKFDADGSRADAELEHFRRQHEARLQSQYSEGELRKARGLIHQSLKASRIRAQAR